MSESTQRGVSWLWFAVGVVCVTVAIDVGASTIYTYTDDQGNIVATDSLANVPEPYRSRAKMREVQDGDPSAPAQETLGNAPPSSFEAMVLRLAGHYPKAVIPGTNAFQSIVLIAGSVAAVLMLAGMNLSANPAVRVLMKFMLGFLVVSAAYLMYFSDMGERAATASGQPGSSGNFMRKARDSAKTQEAIHEQRAKELDAVDQPMQAPK